MGEPGVTITRSSNTISPNLLNDLHTAKSELPQILLRNVCARCVRKKDMSNEVGQNQNAVYVIYYDYIFTIYVI